MRRRHACSRRSATASSSSTGRGRIRLWNSAAQWITGLRGRRRARQAGGHRDPRLGRRSQPRIPVASAGEAARAESIPLQFDDRELWLSISAVGLRGRNGLRVPRPDGRAGARVDATGPRRDRVARAAHAARRDLRRRADAAPRRHRPRGGTARQAARRDRRGVRPSRRHRQRPPAREPARLRQVEGQHRALRSARDRAARDRCGAHPSAGARAAEPRRAGRAARGRRRLRAAAAGDLEPDRERDQVLARRRHDQRRARAERSPRPLRDHRLRPRHPAGRAAADLREVLSPRSAHEPRHRRHRARPLHLPGARAPRRRPDLGRIRRQLRLDLHRGDPAGGAGAGRGGQRRVSSAA